MRILLTMSVLASVWASAAQAQGGPPAGTSPAAANAENQVAEVIVTAERRTTNLQQTAVAATVLSGVDLAASGIVTVDQLQFATPGATVNNFGQGIDFNIRG